jgi:hypothetical protein
LEGIAVASAKIPASFLGGRGGGTGENHQKPENRRCPGRDMNVEANSVLQKHTFILHYTKVSFHKAFFKDLTKTKKKKTKKHKPYFFAA